MALAVSKLHGNGFSMFRKRIEKVKCNKTQIFLGVQEKSAKIEILTKLNTMPAKGRNRF